MQNEQQDFSSKTIAIDKLITKIYNAANDNDLTQSYLLARLLLEEAEQLESIMWNRLYDNPNN